jgi:hypothetical protein
MRFISCIVSNESSTLQITNRYSKFSIENDILFLHPQKYASARSSPICTVEKSFMASRMSQPLKMQIFTGSNPLCPISRHLQRVRRSCRRGDRTFESVSHSFIHFCHCDDANHDLRSLTPFRMVVKIRPAMDVSSRHELHYGPCLRYT